MIGLIVAVVIAMYLVAVWFLKDSPPSDASTEWRRAAQGRALKQNVRIEKHWL